MLSDNVNWLFYKESRLVVIIVLRVEYIIHLISSEGTGECLITYMSWDWNLMPVEYKSFEVRCSNLMWKCTMI